ncbi:hypothetical protein CR513_34305, partial [Mucuna pruriens]
MCHGLKFCFYTRSSNHILLLSPPSLAFQFSYFFEEIKYILSLGDKDTLFYFSFPNSFISNCVPNFSYRVNFSISSS